MGNKPCCPLGAPRGGSRSRHSPSTQEHRWHTGSIRQTAPRPVTGRGPALHTQISAALS